MQRGESIIVGLLMVVGLVAGGLLTTTAWLYQSRTAQAEHGAELIPTAAAAPASTVAPAKPAQAAPPGGDQQKQSFDQNCGGCHPNGGKGVGPSLRGAEFKAKFADDAALKKVLVDGQGMMPGFRQLSEDQLNGLVAYIRSLN